MAVNDIIPKYIVGVACIIKNMEKLLILKRSPKLRIAPGVWEVVAGKVEIGEQPEETIKREITEETNLTVKLEAIPLSIIQTTLESQPMILIYYKGCYISGDLKLSDEHTDGMWVDAESFVELSEYKHLNNLILNRI